MWAGDCLKGDAPQGSGGRLQDAPLSGQEQLETYSACTKNTSRGGTQMEACRRTVFSSGLVIISPSMTCTVWSCYWLSVFLTISVVDFFFFHLFFIY